MAQCKDCIHNEICQFYKALGTYVINNDCGFYKSTADVVPKSEIKKTVAQIAQQEMDSYEAIYKQEVARDIFEDIEKAILTKFPNLGCDILKFAIAELKKKYTESEDTQ